MGYRCCAKSVYRAHTYAHGYRDTYADTVTHSYCVANINAKSNPNGNADAMRGDGAQPVRDQTESGSSAVAGCGIQDDRGNGRSSRTKGGLAKHPGRNRGRLRQHGHYGEHSLALNRFDTR